MSDLPINAVLPQLTHTLVNHTSAVLIAPPGAGKTTRVPLALLDSPWLYQRRIIMLEPRRLAAKNAAAWMAAQLGEAPGKTVGYRMRMDSKVSAQTRIEVVTEGILTRLLQHDPALEEYGLVIFDEFHERSLQADLGLALCLDIQHNLRDDLRLLIMSATLEGKSVAALLNNAPLITSEGRSYPVDIRYFGEDATRKIEQHTVAAVLHALRNETGSVLVFLPGAGEIQRVAQLLNAEIIDPNVSIHALYGNLSQQEQENAITPAKGDTRKIVLATSIAETSLTIEGVRVVIDAGLMRVPQFNQRSAMTSLETVRVTRASSEQRCGRAGRVEPGVCYRLWSEQTQNGLVPYNRPEITQTDLAPFTLELALWGVSDPTQLAWLDPPPNAAYAQAKDLLTNLEALDSQHRITPHGRAMQELGVHPRLAHMLIIACTLGIGSLACDIAALLNERDIFRLRPDERNIDLRLRVEALYKHPSQISFALDMGCVKRVRENANALRKKLSLEQTSSDADMTGVLLALAYPDRVAKRREQSNGRFLLSNGKGALVNDVDSLASRDFLVIAALDGQNREARVFLAAPIEQEQLTTHFKTHIARREFVDWDDSRKLVVARKQTVFGQLILEDSANASPDVELLTHALIKGIRLNGMSALPWNDTSRNWQHRVLFLRRVYQDDRWPDVSDQYLLNTLSDWLAPYLASITRLSQLKELNLSTVLNNMLDWPQQQQLNTLAPTHFDVPSGSRIEIDYATGDTPVLAVRLQELFGLQTTPAIANGKVPLLLHLLSPARRPIQITQDIMSFWSNTYQQVKKDLKGQYPRHYWPDDPLQAQATNRAKPRPR